MKGFGKKKCKHGFGEGMDVGRDVVKPMVGASIAVSMLPLLKPKL